jgi:hypothetical protein
VIRAAVLALALASCASVRPGAVTASTLRVYADPRFSAAELAAIHDAALDLYAESNGAIRVYVDTALSARGVSDGVLLRAPAWMCEQRDGPDGGLSVGWARPDVGLAHVCPERAGEHFERVVAHELLHLLGLRHVGDRDAIMASHATPGAVVLTLADLDEYERARARGTR